MTDRRKFITDTSKAAGMLGLMSLVPSLASAAAKIGPAGYTVQNIIDLILKEGNLTTIPVTVDTIKAGSADTVVTGIVTTMFAHIVVIEQAAKLRANFIIAHEPTFYNHTDNKELVADNPVVQRKVALLQKYNITVWRFHDYLHSLKPDAVMYGLAKKLDWLPYFKTDRSPFIIPPVTLGQLIQHFKTKLGIAHLRVIGKMDQKCETIALIPGAAGVKWHISGVIANQPDVLVVGELSEWETAEFIRDGKLLGEKTSLIILGHALSEEPGMEYLVEWLKPKLPEIKVTHIASGDPFTWI